VTVERGVECGTFQKVVTVERGVECAPTFQKVVAVARSVNDLACRGSVDLPACSLGREILVFLPYKMP
jgi:hypothetical protein